MNARMKGEILAPPTSLSRSWAAFEVLFEIMKRDYKVTVVQWNAAVSAAQQPYAVEEDLFPGQVMTNMLLLYARISTTGRITFNDWQELDTEAREIFATRNAGPAMSTNADRALGIFLTIFAAVSLLLAISCGAATVVFVVFLTPSEWTILTPLPAVCAVLASWTFVTVMRAIDQTTDTV